MGNIFTADIGGTNSRFAHFVTDQYGKLSLVETKWLSTQGSSSFGDLIKQLNASGFSFNPAEADIAVIAVAGPVEKGEFSSPPLISWDIYLSDARNILGVERCLLINDFVAQAFACRSPIGESAEEILSGSIVTDAPVAVVGAGTSLGKAALIPDKTGGFVVLPSEGAHASFPFVLREELEFQRFLRNKTGEDDVTARMVVSGKGISHLHEFLTGEALEPEEVTSKFSLESATFAWSARFYGRVCRNYVLETAAQGGVYIAGGIAAKVPALIKHEAFECEFRNSSLLGAFLSNIPLFLIRNEESGLWGGAMLGCQCLTARGEV